MLVLATNREKSIEAAERISEEAIRNGSVTDLRSKMRAEIIAFLANECGVQATDLTVAHLAGRLEPIASAHYDAVRRRGQYDHNVYLRETDIKTAWGSEGTIMTLRRLLEPLHAEVRGIDADMVDLPPFSRILEHVCQDDPSHLETVERVIVAEFRMNRYGKPTFSLREAMGKYDMTIGYLAGVVDAYRLEHLQMADLVDDDS